VCVYVCVCMCVCECVCLCVYELFVRLHYLDHSDEILEYYFVITNEVIDCFVQYSWYGYLQAYLSYKICHIACVFTYISSGYHC